MAKLPLGEVMPQGVRRNEKRGACRAHPGSAEPTRALTTGTIHTA
jgi:hypothetical protein